MKEVLFITRPMVAPWHEGSKKLVWQLASNLQRYKPHLLTTPLPPDDPYIQWHPIYKNEHLNWAEKGRLLHYLFRRLPSVDLLHSYFVPTYQTSVFLRRVKQRSGMPMVQTIPALPANKLTKANAYPLFYGDQIVCYSEETAVRLTNLGISNVHHIDVGLNLEQYLQGQSDPLLRQRLGAGDEAVVVLFAGEYGRLGGIDILKRTLPTMMAQAPHLHFIFACRILQPADLAVEREMKHLVNKWGLEKRIHFVGEVPYFASLLHSAELFVFPVSEMVGKIETPLTLIEAMAAGLPIVATAVDPLPAMMPEETALLVSPNDDEAFMTAVLNLANEPQKRQTVGHTAKKYAIDRFGLGRMVMTYEELYDALT